jgi:hypothetical protein
MKARDNTENSISFWLLHDGQIIKHLLYQAVMCNSGSNPDGSTTSVNRSEFGESYAPAISLTGTRFVTEGAPKIENIRLTIMKNLFMLHAP